MKLYHGSNVEVIEPQLRRSDRRLDFGAGFYMTSSFDQAARWAQLTTRRRESGRPLVSVHEFDEAAESRLHILRFPSASSEWLQYVGMNRNGDPGQNVWDIVIGPVANDTTMPVLKQYFSGIYTEEEAIRRLLPQNLKDQFAFRTQEALRALTFCEVIAL